MARRRRLSVWRRAAGGTSLATATWAARSSGWVRSGTCRFLYTSRTSSPCAASVSPWWSWRPRRCSGSPLTVTCPSASSCFASPPEPTIPATFSACPSRMVSPLIWSSRTRRTVASVREQDLDAGVLPRRAGEASVGREQRHPVIVELLRQGDVDRVVGGEVLPELPDATSQDRVWVAPDGEVQEIGYGQRCPALRDRTRPD